MAITFSGLSTGLDTDSIVKDIMALERAGIDRVEAKKTEATEKLKAYEQFKSKLDALKSAVGDMSITSQLRSTSASLTSEDSFTASTSSGALGSYNISVAQLSQVQKTISDPFASKTDSSFGTGSIKVNGTAIEITSENNSLIGVAEAINSESATTGVHASIIFNGDEDKGYHLVFTGKDANTSFTIDDSALVDGSGGAFELKTDDFQSARQAVAFIDGIKIVSDTNTISDAISGVTIELNSVSSIESEGPPPTYKTDRMDIKADTEATKEKITSFVTAYNDIMDFILSGYDEIGGTTTTAETTEGDEEVKEELLGGVLRGDATINSMKRQLQSMLTDAVDNDGQFRILSEIGISTNINGTLRQDNTKLDAALENNFDDIVSLLSGDDTSDGVMKGFNSMLLNMTSSTTGVYATQKTSYDSSVKRFDIQIESMELRMTKREATLRNQFTLMEQLVSGLNAQGDFLTQQMDSLNRDK